MNNLKDYILEKFQITKDSKISEYTYKFTQDNDLKGLEINFPMDIYAPDIEKHFFIDKIVYGKNKYNEDIYTCYINNHKFVKLSVAGFKNVLKGKRYRHNRFQQACPKLIEDENGNDIYKHRIIWVDNYDECVLNDKVLYESANTINEKFQITKDSKVDLDIDIVGDMEITDDEIKDIQQHINTLPCKVYKITNKFKLRANTSKVMYAKYTLFLPVTADWDGNVDGDTPILTIEKLLNEYAFYRYSAKIFIKGRCECDSAYYHSIAETIDHLNAEIERLRICNLLR